MEFFLWWVFCSSPSSSILSLTPTTVVINWRTRGSHQAVLWEYSTKNPTLPGSCLQSSLQLLALISFYRLIFLPPFSASTPCLLSSFTLAPSVSPDGTLGRRFVHTPPPRTPSLSLSARASVVVCLPSAEVRFLIELRRKDCFSCVYTGTSRSHRIARSMTPSSAKQVPFLMTISFSSFWSNFIYLPHFNEAPWHSTATAISHHVGSQTWSHSLLPSVFLSSWRLRFSIPVPATVKWIEDELYLVMGRMLTKLDVLLCCSTTLSKSLSSPTVFFFLPRQSEKVSKSAW